MKKCDPDYTLSDINEDSALCVPEKLSLLEPIHLSKCSKVFNSKMIS